MKFIIETGIFEDREKALITAASEKGHEVETVFNPRPFMDDVPTQNSDTPIFFYGSLNVAKRLLRRKDTAGSVFLDLPKFECSSYYNTPWLKHLLNRDCLFIPYENLIHQKELLFHTFGKDNCIFIRPSSGDKVFTGQLVDDKTYKEDIDYLSFYMDDIHKPLCVVSSPKVINKEYRFFISEDKVITGSSYTDDYQYQEIDTNHPASKYVQDIVHDAYHKNYAPQILYVVDIAETSTGFKVLELNSASCSAIYACNPNKIVDTINNLYKN